MFPYRYCAILFRENPLLTNYRCITTVPNIDKLNEIISEPNIKKCVDRMKNIRLTGRIKEDNAKASVFIPFCHNKERIPSILFTQRSFVLSKHKGEVCFPGGMEEKGDSSVIDSAIRETMEEIGVTKESMQIYGVLNPANFNEISLYPVLGYLNIDHNRGFNLNLDEVDSIHIVRLDKLIDTNNWHMTKWLSGYTTPVFKHHEHPKIWGMTASILYIVLASLAPKYFPFDSGYLNRKPLKK